MVRIGKYYGGGAEVTMRQIAVHEIPPVSHTTVAETISFQVRNLVKSAECLGYCYLHW